MNYYLDFYELSCTAKDDLINFAIGDYLKRYGYDEIYNDMMGTDLDYEDVLFNKASRTFEHHKYLYKIIKGEIYNE